MKKERPFSKDIVQLEKVEKVVEQIITKLKYDVLNKCRRNGAIVGISGGVDSSICLALASIALGPENVIALMMPEKDSNLDSERLAEELASLFNVKSLILEDMTDILNSYKCYNRRDDAVTRVFPNYNPSTHKMKIVTKQRGLYSNLPPAFSLTIIDQNENEKDQTLILDDYLQIVAASNFKQRARMSMIYYYAEANHYAVIGTANKHEFEQGFFVKYGDGGADVMPISDLYKTQVYQIAEYLGIPKKIINRVPTSDTYSAEQTQQEFFFQLPFKIMDLYWYAFENGYSQSEVAQVMDETEERVRSIFDNFKRKKRTTDYLRMNPIRGYYSQ